MTLLRTPASILEQLLKGTAQEEVSNLTKYIELSWWMGLAVEDRRSPTEHNLQKISRGEHSARGTVVLFAMEVVSATMLTISSVVYESSGKYDAAFTLVMSFELMV